VVLELSVISSDHAVLLLLLGVLGMAALSLAQFAEGALLGVAVDAESLGDAAGELLPSLNASLVDDLGVPSEVDDLGDASVAVATTAAHTSSSRSGRSASSDASSSFG